MASGLPPSTPGTGGGAAFRNGVLSCLNSADIFLWYDSKSACIMVSSRSPGPDPGSFSISRHPKILTRGEADRRSIALVTVVDAGNPEKGGRRMPGRETPRQEPVPTSKNVLPSKPEGVVEESMVAEGRRVWNRAPEHGTPSVPEGRSHAEHGNELSGGGRQIGTFPSLKKRPSEQARGRSRGIHGCRRAPRSESSAGAWDAERPRGAFPRSAWERAFGWRKATGVGSRSVTAAINECRMTRKVKRGAPFGVSCTASDEAELV